MSELALLQPFPTTFPHVVKVHEKTVQTVANGELEPLPKERKRRNAGPVRVIESHSIKVVDQIWDAALRIAERMEVPRSHIQIISRVRVTVHQRPWR